MKLKAVADFIAEPLGSVTSGQTFTVSDSQGAHFVEIGVAVAYETKVLEHIEVKAEKKPEPLSVSPAAPASQRQTLKKSKRQG